MQLTFTQNAAGPRVKGHCVAQTKVNRGDRACKRLINRGVLAVGGHTGSNKVFFQGRISQSQKLKPGNYTLLINATVTAKSATAAAAPLTFTIVR